METVYFQGKPCHTYGTLPRVGEKAPCFTLVRPDLSEVHCSDFTGKRVVLNIFPSLDTPVCATSVRRFNEKVSDLKDTVVLCVSMDLPFAAERFCSAEGLDKIIPASAFRAPMFAQKYGVQIVDGPLAGLLTRSVVVIDEHRHVIYSQLVEEITEEPDYRGVINILKQDK